MTRAILKGRMADHTNAWRGSLTDLARRCLLVHPVILCLLITSFAAAGDPDALEQAAFRAAVDRIAPAVVRIETIGGLERVGQVLFGTGPTTGLVVDPAGYIVSSAFSFVNEPSSILVRLGDGSRKSAKLVATDHSRMLVLLKIDVDGPLPTCEAAAARDIRVGQWAIAVGRTFESERPNMAVGIVSALDRVWGKAIQTDAAVSPNNYGGPLVDIHGRVLGVLVPLSPEAADETAGVEWYDSGIGFAIPLEQIQKVLPRLKKGEDLSPGLAGISMKGPSLYTGEPVIAHCRQKSPAAEAGLKVGDRVLEIDGRKIVRTADLKQELGHRYAGDKVHVTVLRGQQRIERELQLVAKLPPFQHGFFGILPLRTDKEDGVGVRYVYPGSPADRVGVTTDDTVVSLQGEPLENRIELMTKMGLIEPGSEVELELSRAGVVRKVNATLTALPESLPPKDLPPARSSELKEDAARPAVGSISLKVPEFANETRAYVPDGYSASVPYGVVIWLHGPDGVDWPQLLARWKPLCERYDLILVAPKAADAAHWTSGEAALVPRLLIEVAAKYDVDPSRVVVHGYESGGLLAFAAALRNLEAIRAVAAVEAAPQGEVPENDPLRRLAVYMAAADKSTIRRQVESSAAAFREKGIPVTMKRTGDVTRYLDDDELAELVRWVDMLDRI